MRSFPRIRRLNISAVTAVIAAGHNPRRYPSLLSAASAVGHGLPDGNAPQANPGSGSDEYALEGPLVVDRSTLSTHRCLVASPESVDATTGFLTARRQGRTRTGAAIIIRRDQHVHRGTGLVPLAARCQYRGCPFSHALSEDSWRVRNLGYERIPESG